MAIISFRDKDCQKVYLGQRSRKFGTIARRALIQLRRIDASHLLDDLRVPPGNRLEALKGDRRGQHSIRIDHQWRICFVWKDGDAHDVEIVDYH
ncbi:type II toxin-antitoxin system RelE/ParE family toxin [Pyruvatibacter sp.]|uniref:type II toxin-antitoxin system RelE/ParE family toxin n=1 Tax=Pyruvatibacter sp. TaxID=1981328 RepID=UPI0032EFB1D1